MTELRDLLVQHVQDLTPPAGPGFPGVRERVVRRRRTRVLAASLAVVVVGAGTTLALQPSGRQAADPLATPSAPLPGATAAPGIEVAGRSLQLERTRPVRVALRVDGDADAVRVAGSNVLTDVDCQGWDVARLVGQNAGSVSLAVDHYSHGRITGCFGEGQHPPGEKGRPGDDLLVPLGTALGNRKVVDVTVSRTVPVLDLEHDFLVADHLPQGVQAAAETIDVAPGQPTPFVLRRYARPGLFVTLVMGPPAAVAGTSIPSSLTALQVRGHAGQLLGYTGYATKTRCLSWQERADLPVLLCAASEHGQLPLVDLLQVADGLHTPAPHRGKAPLAQVPSFVTVSGVRHDLVGPLPVEVVYAGTAGRELVVRAGQATDPGGCGLLVRSFVLSDDSGSVTVGTYTYGLADPPTSCSPAPVGDSAAQVLRLARPLGSRFVVSQTDYHRLVPVIREGDWLDATYLPTGYGPGTFSGGRGREADGFGMRTWLSNGGAQRLNLVQGSVQAVTRVAGLVTGHVSVRGHQGELLQVRGEAYPARCLRWSEASADVVQLCSHGGPDRLVVPDADLLRIAEGLRRG
jgi:hypothetical protein